jgi:hypothetical protein
MIKKKSRIVLCCLVAVVFFFNGCTSKTLDPEFIEKTKVIAIDIIPPNDNFTILDHTGIYENKMIYIPTYSGGSAGQGAVAGAVGGAVSATIAGITVHNQIKNSIGGTPEVLLEIVCKEMIKDKVSSSFKTRCGEIYQVYVANDLNFLKSSENKKKKQVVKHNLSLSKQNAVDCYICLEYYCGLAAYVGDDSSVAIDGKIEIYDVNTRKKVLSTSMLSDRCFKHSCPLEQHEKDSGKSYLVDMEKAADSIALQIATFFNIDIKEAKEKEVDDVILLGKVKKDYPYVLTQDYSWLGLKRCIKIDEYKIKVAGSEDGSVVFFMYDNFGDKLGDALSFGSRQKSTEKLRGFETTVRALLAKQGLNVLERKRVVVPDMGMIGLFLKFDKDAYSLLKPYSI